MTEQDIYRLIRETWERLPGNLVHLERTGAEIPLFEAPLIGVSLPEDRIYDAFSDPAVIGPDWMHPGKWLPGARSVIAFFFPFTEEVRKAEAAAGGLETSEAWLYGRVEGQALLDHFSASLMETLTANGIRCCVPTLDPRFSFETVSQERNGRPDFHVSSRWSERHAAYASGLGTFGMTRGLLTKKGSAGRVASIITDASLTPTERSYQDIYEYCIRCGACARRCPAGAISMESGKNNVLCKGRLDVLRKQYAPRYGCGKCQTRVPCESRLPKHTGRNGTV